jgi:muramoyltetrapeptide carboxypeptidase
VGHQPIRPSRLRPGDRVAVVSPSSTIADQADIANQACRNLESVLDLKLDFAPHALGKHFYSAGTARDRTDDLMSAFRDRAVSVILLSMGGATAIDLIDDLDYGVIAENPKIVAGISDSSTLLDAITAKTGLVTFHGLELFDFARHDMSYTEQSMRSICFDAWSGSYRPNPDWRDLDGETTTYGGWREVKPGRARGMALGGNSDAFMQLIDTEYCPSLDGSVLFLETYRLQKRHIQALFVELRLRNVFDRISGLVIGYCLGSDAPGTGNDRDLADIAREVLADRHLPVIQIGEVGHQVENLILPIGATIEFDTARLSLTLVDPAVS